MRASSRPPSANDLARAAVADVVAAKNAPGNRAAGGSGGDEEDDDGRALHPAKAVAHPPSLPAMSGAPSSRGGGQSSRGPSASPSGGTDGGENDEGNNDESGSKRQHQQQQQKQKNQNQNNPTSTSVAPLNLVPAVPVNAHRQPRLPPEERAARMRELSSARQALERLPMGETFEIPGRPGLMYELRDYSKPYGRVSFFSFRFFFLVSSAYFFPSLSRSLPPLILCSLFSLPDLDGTKNKTARPQGRHTLRATGPAFPLPRLRGGPGPAASAGNETGDGGSGGDDPRVPRLDCLCRRVDA